ncbi:hypothetical protein PJ900_18680 [Tistrella mobilis]|uniref:Pyridoxamine 5'-phosphate oxidase putative domain-containing protein n=2 Tax=Tistrella mobilis TaxID=171437 RepID=I3TJH1_TISMK|nr:hypothetical protein [Tistrella mobilis]AFK52909.1 hypothetical protein TMO_1070 [Tistrella mobilis KA081020-065]KYO49620.1 hypothetical protein AUP44_01655 [Tistrella mobilis]
MARLVYHEGEREAHRRFGVEDEAAEISDMVTDRLSLGVRRFIEARSIVFVTTVDGTGRPVTAFKARPDDMPGQPPLIRAADSKRLIMALQPWDDLDVLDNCLQDDIGIGLLFVDFDRRARYRVNGRCRAVDPAAIEAEMGTLWPQARALVEVTVDQAYANCPARIVRLIAAD